MTKIITTIGPASENQRTLHYFGQHSVAIARLNGSHNTHDWHVQAAKKARNAGLEVMLDLPGPKMRLGKFEGQLELKAGERIIFESELKSKSYPYKEHGDWVVPVYKNINVIIDTNETVLVNDGLIILKTLKNTDKRSILEIKNDGVISSNKSINLPESEFEIDFLTDKDNVLIDTLIPDIKPDYVSISFVKTRQDVVEITNLIKESLETHGVTDYFPKLVAKIETQMAVTSKNLAEIVEAVDMVMIARGDLALETHPNHLLVPFLQEKIINTCNLFDKPFIIATQMLESMTSNPTPTRAEMSDLYRAVVSNNANYVMLSGESASGKYPRQTVKMMSDFITKCK